MSDRLVILAEYCPEAIKSSDRATLWAPHRGSPSTISTTNKMNTLEVRWPQLGIGSIKQIGTSNAQLAFLSSLDIIESTTMPMMTSGAIAIAVRRPTVTYSPVKCRLTLPLRLTRPFLSISSRSMTCHRILPPYCFDQSQEISLIRFIYIDSTRLN